MTPPAAAAAPRTRTRPATAPPRRRSGPSRSTRPRVGVAAPTPLALRIGGAVHGLAEHRLFERIIRGRAWIAILTVGLIGIVFMQVSMLRMNAGIGRAVETASTLERENAALRASISELSSGDHIEAVAARQGLILPTATPRFLDAAHFDTARALSSITAPGTGVVSLSAATAAASGLTATQLAPTGVAPSPDAAAAGTTPASTTPAAGAATSTTSASSASTTTPTSTTTPAAATTPTSSSSTPSSTTTTASPPPAATTASTTGGAAGAPAG